MALFSGLIKCKRCKGNYKFRLDGSKKIPTYICSKYDNYSQCKRIPIKEEFIIWCLENRFQRKLSDNEIRESVQLIEVEDKLQLEIHIKEQESILFGKNFIRY